MIHLQRESIDIDNAIRASNSRRCGNPNDEWRRRRIASVEDGSFIEATGDNFVGRGNFREWDVVLVGPLHRSVESSTVWPHVGCVTTVVIGNNGLNAAIEERDDREVLQVESTIVESKDRSVGINEVAARELSTRGVFIRIVHLLLIDDDEDEVRLLSTILC